MFSDRFIFSQIMEHLPWSVFDQCVTRYDGDKYVKAFTCADQYRCMAFAQLTYRTSLRDIETCLRTQATKLYHMGIRGGISRTTLASANQVRDWKIFSEFAQKLIHFARNLHADDALSGLNIDDPVYALDSTTIDLCLSLFPWAQFRKTKGAIKLHTLLDLHGNIPTFLHISDGKLHDVNVMDYLPPEAEAFYIMDRAYLDFDRLYRMHLCGSLFVLRAKSNTRLYRIASKLVNRSSGVNCDQIVKLSGVNSKTRYPKKLRRIKYRDTESGKVLVFITNNFTLPPKTIAALYKSRWQIELFFKWIKQHLRIKSFFGTSENAVKSQIWIVVSVYVIIAIIRKRLHIEESLHTILQILSLTTFEKTSLKQLLSLSAQQILTDHSDKQLNLFNC